MIIKYARIAPNGRLRFCSQSRIWLIENPNSDAKAS